MPFAHTHLSYSRLARFEQCPLSFKLHYIDRKPAEPGLPLRFGQAIHAALEQLIRQAVDAGQKGPLPLERALACFAEHWAKANLSGTGLFGEGVAILKDFVRDQGVLDPATILGIEQEFRLPLGKYEVLGFLDRVERIDENTLEVIDYKTNHQLFSREELDSSLQMSLYALAAQALWPWAKEIRLIFWMLRHGIRQTTARTSEQLEAAKAYVLTLGRQTETATEYPARLQPNCAYCDHRQDCPAYANVLQGSQETLPEAFRSVEEVAAERERLAARLRILQGRKSELEQTLKEHLKRQDSLTAGGLRYAMVPVRSVEYPLQPTVRLLTEATNQTDADITAAIAVVDKSRLKELIDKLGEKLERSQWLLLRAQLEAHTSRQWTSRLVAQKVATA